MPRRNRQAQWAQQHAVACKEIGELINLSSVYLQEERGSSDEALAERALLSAIQEAVTAGPIHAGALLYTLAVMVAETGDQETVQAWMNEQAAIVAEVMRNG